MRWQQIVGRALEEPASLSAHTVGCCIPTSTISTLLVVFPQIRARLEFVADFAMMFSSCSSSEQNQMFKRSVKCNWLSAHSFKPGTPIQSQVLRGFPFYLLRRGNGHPLIRPLLLNVGILALSPMTCSYLATGSLN